MNFESIVVKADVQSKDLIKEVERGLGGKAIKLTEELHEPLDGSLAVPLRVLLLELLSPSPLKMT
jgi:hypothetical protein